MKKLLFIAFLTIIIGCGGGTSGTGGTGNSEIVGKIADTDGQPIASAQIVVEETGDNTISDVNGEFDFESNISTDKVTVLVTTNSTEAKAIVDEIPAGPQIINLSLVVDQREKTVRIREKEIKPRPRRPRPTPTVVPAVTATVIPTTGPTIEPTVSVTVTPDSTATPTAELFTQFVGKIVSSDSTLLSDAKVGIVGKGRRIVRSDGTFRFRIRAAVENSHLVVASGGKVARMRVEEINEKTKRARLQLRLERKPDSSLTLTLEIAEIMQY